MNNYDNKEKIIRKIQSGEFSSVAYGTTGTHAYFDPDTEKYYNDGGQELRSPEDYHADPDSYYENQNYDD